MRDSDKDKEQLIKELAEVRMRAARLGAMVATHRQVEKALARERNQLRTVIDALPDYVFFKDSEGRFINANLAAARWLGVESPQQLIARTDFDYHPPRVAGQFYTDEQAVIKSGQPLQNKEMPAAVSGDKEVWHLHTKVPLKNDRGKIVGLVGIVRDISEHKLVEAADKRKSKELFGVLIQNSLDIIIRLDKDGVIQYISPSVQQVLGHLPGYYTGKNIVEIVHPEDARQVEQYFVATPQNVAHALPQAEFRIQQSTGSWANLEVRANNLLNEPDIQSVIINGRDVTGRKQAETALQTSERKNRALLEAIPDLMIRMDRDGTYLEVIPSRVHGSIALSTEMVGKNIADFMPRAVAVQRIEAVRKALDTGVPQLVEYALSVQNKFEYYEARIVVSGHNETLTLVRDITDRKRSEATLRQSEERYRQLLENTQETLVETEALYSVSQTLIDYENLPTLLQGVLDKVRGALLAGTVLLITVNLKTQQITEYVTSGHPEITATKLSFDELMAGVSGWAIREQKAVLLPKGAVDERERHNCGQAGSTIVAPLRCRDKVLGTITAINRKNDPDFTRKDVEFLMAIASQVAITIENAHLYKQAHQDAETKAILLNEVNHRVKNNLAAIIGLLYAEQNHTVTGRSAPNQDISKNMISRIQGLATVHQLLSVSDWSPVSLSELAEQVIDSALQMVPPDKEVAVSVSSSPVRVTPEQSNNLALIINELTTNTAKYAFAKQEDVCINVSITNNNGIVVFEYKDNGPGYPEPVLNGGQHSVGIYLIETIVSNGLRGDVTLRNEQGSMATIHFPAER